MWKSHVFSSPLWIAIYLVNVFGFSCRNFKKIWGLGDASLVFTFLKKMGSYRLNIHTKKAVSDTGQSQVNYNQNLKTLLWAFRNHFYQMIWIESVESFLLLNMCWILQRSMSIAQHQQANPTPGGPGGQAPTEVDWCFIIHSVQVVCWHETWFMHMHIFRIDFHFCKIDTHLEVGKF